MHWDDVRRLFSNVDTDLFLFRMLSDEGERKIRGNGYFCCKTKIR